MSYLDSAQQLYVAFFGRPADAGGRAAFAGELQRLLPDLRSIEDVLVAYRSELTAFNLEKINNPDAPLPPVLQLLSSFTRSDESRALYNPDDGPEAFVRAVYRNVLAREIPPADEGLQFWTSKIRSGELDPAFVSLEILFAALRDDGNGSIVDFDRLTVIKKTEIAQLFTDRVNTPGGRANYSTLEDVVFARQMLNDVDSSTDIGSFNGRITETEERVFPTQTLTLSNAVGLTTLPEKFVLIPPFVSRDAGPIAVADLSSALNVLRPSDREKAVIAAASNSADFVVQVLYSLKDSAENLLAALQNPLPAGLQSIEATGPEALTVAQANQIAMLTDKPVTAKVQDSLNELNSLEPGNNFDLTEIKLPPGYQPPTMALLQSSGGQPLASAVAEGQSVKLKISRADTASNELFVLKLSSSAGALRDTAQPGTQSIVFEQGVETVLVDIDVLNDLNTEGTENLLFTLHKGPFEVASANMDVIDNAGTGNVPVSITYQNESGIPLQAGVNLDDQIKAAFAYLERFVSYKGQMDVQVVVEQTATGRFAGSGSVTFVQSEGSGFLLESAAASESRTGTDQFDSPDFSIFIDPFSSYLNGLYWDQNILESLDGPIPLNKTDAFSVVLHEILHGMGFNGYVRPGENPREITFNTRYDRSLLKQGNDYFFTGNGALALTGESLEVTSSGTQAIYHFGAGASPFESKQPYLATSIMNGYFFLLGERYEIGRLELAILQDLGWSLDTNSTALFSLTNELSPAISSSSSFFFPNAGEPKFYVGYEDRSDLIVGSNFDDTIKGFGGNDVFVHTGGKNSYDGGSGFDRLLVADGQAKYSLNKVDNLYRLFNFDSAGQVSTLVGVEVVEFSDGFVALS